MTLAGWWVLAVFVVTYVLFFVMPERKWITGLSSAGLLVATGVLGPLDAMRAIDLNVLLIFGGTLILADLFMESQVPEVMADWIAEHSPNVATSMVALCALTGLLSIAIENVAAVLVVAPVCFVVAEKARVSPVPLLIGAAVSSNLQGAATLIGDPPSILLGSYAGLTFNEFFWYEGRPGIFFAVQLAAIVGLVVLAWAFRHLRQPVPDFEPRTIITMVPTWCLVGLVVTLALVSTFRIGGHNALGITCAAWSALALAWTGVARLLPVGHVVRRYDWQTTLFLISVFVVVAALVKVGIVNALAEWGGRTFVGAPLAAFVSLAILSVALSAFIDNVPYVAAMLPVVDRLALGLGVDPAALYFGLLVSASVGGNITPIGASANIVAVGALAKRGHPVTVRRFVRIGLPYTLATVTVATLFIWLVFGT